MTTDRIALAIFVKTPGVSPVKTRLAAGIGQARAQEFYRLALDCAREYVTEACKKDWRLQPYWAVAEQGTANYWSGFPVIYQGQGELGTRLWRVYQQLRHSHSWIIFIGADSPQLESEALVDATRAALSGNDPFVLGCTEDGGYYLFGGSREVPQEIWESVPYSSSETARCFSLALRTIGSVQSLAPAFDVDEGKDLTRLKDALLSRKSLLPAQRNLMDWLLKLAAEG